MTPGSKNKNLGDWVHSQAHGWSKFEISLEGFEMIAVWNDR